LVFLVPRIFAFRGPAPVVAVFRNVADDVVRLAAGGAEPSVFDKGEAVLAIPLPAALAPALRNGDGVRPTTGGVAVREIGGVGRLIDGLSQEEKKSSSGSPAGVELPSAASALAASVMTTSVGYLRIHKYRTRNRQARCRTQQHLSRPVFSIPPCILWRHLIGILSLGPCCSMQQFLHSIGSTSWPTRYLRLS
jgi:hypothetical protein